MRVKSRNSKKKRRLCLKIIALLCIIPWLFSYISDANININSATLGSAANFSSKSTGVVNHQGISIHSTNAILMDLESGAILLDIRGTDKMYPASLTKIMTAIVALEQISDLNEPVILREEVFQPINDANAVIAGFLPGESVRAIDLLYGLILSSGAECAIGLAEHVAGSEKAFVELMNNKAKEIGLSGSNFTNTTGLHNKNQYSTAMDMALLFKYALADSTFYEIITSPRHYTQPSNRRTDGVTLFSTMFSRMESADMLNGHILGGKTGYTKEAGQCLASLAVIDNTNYILITTGAAGNNQTQRLHIDDAFAVYSALLYAQY